MIHSATRVDDSLYINTRTLSDQVGISSVFCFYIPILYSLFSIFSSIIIYYLSSVLLSHCLTLSPDDDDHLDVSSGLACLAHLVMPESSRQTLSSPSPFPRLPLRSNHLAFLQSVRINTRHFKVHASCHCPIELPSWLPHSLHPCRQR